MTTDDHSVHTVRRVSGWRRWYAICSCGWHSEFTSKDEAERYVQQHAAESGHRHE